MKEDKKMSSAQIMLWGTLILGGLIVVLWAIYYLTVGTVPDSTSLKIAGLPVPEFSLISISRWYDFIFIPLWLLIMIPLMKSDILDQEIRILRRNDYLEGGTYDEEEISVGLPALVHFFLVLAFGLLIVLYVDLDGQLMYVFCIVAAWSLGMGINLILNFFGYSYKGLSFGKVTKIMLSELVIYLPFMIAYALGFGLVFFFSYGLTPSLASSLIAASGFVLIVVSFALVRCLIYAVIYLIKAIKVVILYSYYKYCRVNTKKICR
jgi:hypothetical protein